MSSTVSRVLYQMIIYLDCTLPHSSFAPKAQNATYPKARRAAVSLSVSSCSEWGLHSLLRYRKSGGLLHRHSTLTDQSRRFLFCCTILQVTPTGRYPAPCPVEPGLSSPQRGAIICATLPYPNTIPHFCKDTILSKCPSHLKAASPYKLPQNGISRNIITARSKEIIQKLQQALRLRIGRRFLRYAE